MPLSRTGQRLGHGRPFAVSDGGRFVVGALAQPEVADAIGDRWDDRRGGVVVGGCGMNMCFATVYALGRALFPDGFGIVGEKDGKRRRPKTAKAAAQMVRAGWRFRGRNGDTNGWDNDGGYALRYR